MVENLGELDLLVLLVELNMLFHFVGVLEIMKSWGGLSIQNCKSATFSSHLWHLFDLGMSQIDCRLVALLIW